MTSVLTALRAIATGHALFPIVLLVLVLLPSRVHGLDPLGIDHAATQVRGAVATMSGAVSALPEQVQAAVGADIHILGNEVNHTLDKIQNRTVPLVNSAIVADLDHMADLAGALASNLQELEATALDQLDEDVAARIAQMQQVMADSLERVDAVVDGWLRSAADSVIQVEEKAGAVVIKSMDRLLYDGIRYTCITALLVGLFTLGLTCLRFLEQRVPWSEVTRSNPRLSIVSGVLLTTFFATSLALSIDPGLLASLSARAEVHPREHPCDRHRAHEGHVATAGAIADAGLIDAARQRLVRSARDCFGLTSDEAVARLIPAAAVAPAGDGHGDRGVAAVDPPSAPTVAEAEQTEQRRELGAPRRVFVTATAVNYRSGPGIGHRRLGTFARGTRVTVVGERDGWYEVRLPDGRPAYISEHYLVPAL